MTVKTCAPPLSWNISSDVKLANNGTQVANRTVAEMSRRKLTGCPSPWPTRRHHGGYDGAAEGAQRARRRPTARPARSSPGHRP